jgi:hypothetical protein
MEFLIVLAILAIVALFVSRPLWREVVARRSDSHERSDAVADLEAARDAKYREIRDAELDHRTGKLSEADYEAIDRALRAEAIEILRALDEVREREGRVPGDDEAAPDLAGEQLPSHER